VSISPCSELIFTQALVEATINEKYKSVVDSACLLVFFATPHRGGNYTTPGDVAASIARKFTARLSNDLIEGLKETSDQATKRFRDFKYLNEKFLFVSFYEGKGYGLLGKVCPGIIGIPFQTWTAAQSLTSYTDR
jgi:hypothetical protein